MKIGYLGPEESYTHIAAKNIFANYKDIDFKSHSSISELIEKLAAGDLNQAIVPIENSIEGGVNETMDALVKVEGIYICHEYNMPIKHALLSKTTDSISGIKKIYAHPQTLAQCRNYIKENCSDAKLENSSSNSAAALHLSKSAEDGAATIASESSAEIYGLKVLDKEINDEPNNETKFYVLGKDPMPPSAKDKTTIVFKIKDEPGSLIKVLEHFNKQNINLSKIESRPSKKQLGEYTFYVDLDIHKEDPSYAEALKNVKLSLSYYRWLGSYNLID